MWFHVTGVFLYKNACLVDYYEKDENKYFFEKIWNQCQVNLRDQLLTKKEWSLLYHAVFLSGLRYRVVYIGENCQDANILNNVGI